LVILKRGLKIMFKVALVECVICGKRFKGDISITVEGNSEDKVLYNKILSLVRENLKAKGWGQAINLREVLEGNTNTLLCTCPECSRK
jgi:hypothetical protein